jgi:RNA polymerase sigma-70 factor (ECF subfamily)
MGGVGGVLTLNRAVAADDQPAAPAAAKSPATRPAAAADKPAARGAGRSVVATADPVVVETVPRSGSTDVDAAAVTELRVTFSKDMIDGNWAWAQTSKDTFPQTTGKPRYEPDGRTCVLPVKLDPGKGYVIWLNKPPFDSFMSQDKRKALPYLLVFETKP